MTYDEPMRLLGMIEAPPARISAIIQKHAILHSSITNGSICWPLTLSPSHFIATTPTPRGN